MKRLCFALEGHMRLTMSYGRSVVDVLRCTVPSSAPINVRARAVSSSTVVAQWDEPRVPNGIVRVGLQISSANSYIHTYIHTAVRHGVTDSRPVLSRPAGVTLKCFSIKKSLPAER